MQNQRRLRELRAWVAEFKRHFKVHARFVCAIEDLDNVARSCRDKNENLAGLSAVSNSCKTAYITLSPRAWDETSGPYALALHEFTHCRLSILAKGDHEADAEERAVEELTRIYLPLVSGKKETPL